MDDLIKAFSSEFIKAWLLAHGHPALAVHAEAIAGAIGPVRGFPVFLGGFPPKSNIISLVNRYLCNRRGDCICEDLRIFFLKTAKIDDCVPAIHDDCVGADRRRSHADAFYGHRRSLAARHRRMDQ